MRACVAWRGSRVFACVHVGRRRSDKQTADLVVVLCVKRHKRSVRPEHREGRDLQRLRGEQRLSQTHILSRIGTRIGNTYINRYVCVRISKSTNRSPPSRGAQRGPAGLASRRGDRRAGLKPPQARRGERAAHGVSSASGCVLEKEGTNKQRLEFQSQNSCCSNAQCGGAAGQSRRRRRRPSRSP
jgi:hypothetical protein